MHVKGLAVEDLVRCSALECSVGHDAVVLVDVEGHELLDRSEAIEPIQVEPVMLQVAPPGLMDKAFQPPSAGAAVDIARQSATFPARFTSAGCTHEGGSDSMRSLHSRGKLATSGATAHVIATIQTLPLALGLFILRPR